MRAIAVTVFLAFASSATAADSGRGRPWLRRLTAAAACAASFWDAHSTAVAVRSGALESNPLLADSSGRPRWGRIIGFKAGMCAASLFVQERFNTQGQSDRFWIGINAGSAGAFTALSIRNLRIAGETPSPKGPGLSGDNTGTVSNLTDRAP